jgi:outer membrane biosynthesis protein TonB
VEQPKPEERTVDQRAMFPGRGNTASTALGQGAAGEPGNQGTPPGTPGVHVYGEGGDVGGGIKFVLKGRDPVGKIPKLAGPETIKEQVTVVVDIKVDKNGNVIYVRAGAKGTSSMDYPELFTAAEKAARELKFTPTDVLEQKGTIICTFKLKGD